MLTALRLQAADTARRAGLAASGTVLLAVGAVFLTIAAWIYLAATASAFIAALVIGTLYFGLGLIFLGLSRRPRPLRHPARVDPMAARPGSGYVLPALVEAFTIGMSAARRRRR